MECELIELDDRARRYIIDKLNPPYPLSKAFLQSTDLRRGRVLAVWPKESSRDRIYRFTGAVFAPPRQFSPSHAENWFVDYVCEYLGGHDSRIVVFEDRGPGRDRPASLRTNTHKMYLGNDVFHYLLGQDNERETVAIHVNNSTSWTNWILFSSLPDQRHLTDDGELDSDTINSLIANAEMCAIDAYDFESYLVWEL
jgi:hypothetical protein